MYICYFPVDIVGNYKSIIILKSYIHDTWFHAQDMKLVPPKCEACDYT